MNGLNKEVWINVRVSKHCHDCHFRGTIALKRSMHAILRSSVLFLCLVSGVKNLPLFP